MVLIPRKTGRIAPARRRLGPVTRHAPAPQLPPEQVVAVVPAIGCCANGTARGGGAPAATTIASPPPGCPGPDGPVGSPHQLQVASIGAWPDWFGPMRSPA